MIVVLQRDITEEQKKHIQGFLVSKGFKVREIVGEEETIFGAVGSQQIDQREVEIIAGVDRVIPISKPFKLASRELKKEDTIVQVGPVKIGGKRIAVIAGPCAIESREQIMEAAQYAYESGAVILRGGAYKPRTSPYDFQGLGEEGLKYLKEAGETYGLPVVAEIVATETAEMAAEYLDIFQIGARNMQNFELLKKVGSVGKPVILKRGLCATIKEWLMAAEYLMAHGADNVILCERGIRTFETYTRNTLDLSAIPVIKKLSHLPVIVDPSHATGIREKVLPLGLAGISAGADGLMVEMHPNPDKALSDGPQSLYPDQLEKLLRDIQVLSPVLGKEVARLPAEVPQELVSKGKSTDSDRIVAFQGERGAFSEMALHHYFDESEFRPLATNSFYKVFDSVLKGEAKYGVIPIENSLSGSIHENYDLLLQFPDVKIVGEQKIRIEHALIGTEDSSLEGLKRIYSHPQALAQCSSFLSTLQGVEQVPFYDTAGSVEFVAKQNNPSYASIASKEAAAVHRMKILKEGIESNPRNYTRFVILAREENADIANPNKISIVFSAQDKPGSLFKCLETLMEENLNMKKIESRPILGKPWQYMFYVDIEELEPKDSYKDAIERLKKRSKDLRVLGTYRVE